MSLNYTDALSAVRARLVADATISANIQKIGTDTDQACIFTLRAPPDATNAKPYIVLTRVSMPEAATFAGDAVELTFDLHVYVGNSQDIDPFASGASAKAIMNAARAALNRWQPTVSGCTASRVWWVDETDAHDDVSWHWVQTYRVYLTE